MDARIFEKFTGPWADARRIEWLTRLESIYVEQGVLTNGKAPALDRTCPSCSTCWADADDRRPPHDEGTVEGFGDAGSIFWPWVGKDYRAGGVCFVSLNVNAGHGEDYWWSVANEYGIADIVFEAFAAENRSPFGHPFYWRLTCAAQAMLDSVDGASVREEPQSVPAGRDVLERIARVQAVKCSPLGEASKPTSAMITECPARFAGPELDLLEPGVIVLLGNDVFGAFLSVYEDGLHWYDDSWTTFKRGELRTTQMRTEVFWMNHPASRGPAWGNSMNALVASLTERPLAAPG